MAADLFSDNLHTNLLPFDGEVIYFGRVFTAAEAEKYYAYLLDNISWKNDEAYLYGKHYVTKRKVAWYGDLPYAYAYSNTIKKALPWTEELLQLKTIAETQTQSSYNSCLLNLYHTGEEGMAWHSDDEKTLGTNLSIASISFGAERKFMFKHKTEAHKINLFLENGSLLEMKGSTQQYWLHRLPPSKKIIRPRINLTFRTIVS